LLALSVDVKKEVIKSAVTATGFTVEDKTLIKYSKNKFKKNMKQTAFLRCLLTQKSFSGLNTYERK